MSCFSQMECRRWAHDFLAGFPGYGFFFEDKWIDGRTLFRVIVGMRVSFFRHLVFVDNR
jgi:hypothetical protein